LPEKLSTSPSENWQVWLDILAISTPTESDVQGKKFATPSDRKI
jgi:hypothetical protein